jgi:prepilin-type N-terminal cleavage/methylation domain-containing protein
MSLLNKRARGMTVLELLVVIAVIAFLAGALGIGLNRMRMRARDAQIRTLLQKVDTALEVYKLSFRDYPPIPLPGYTDSEALFYYICTPFRVAPDASRGEKLSTVQGGPYISEVNTNEKKDFGTGNLCFTDPWGEALVFKYLYKTDLNGYSIATPLIYSKGENKIDELADGDDVYVGAK